MKSQRRVNKLPLVQQHDTVAIHAGFSDSGLDFSVCLMINHNLLKAETIPIIQMQNVLEPHSY